jgi:hypothetical protein
MNKPFFQKESFSKERMAKWMKEMREEIKKQRIGELFLILGAGLFVAGAIGFIAGYLSQEQIPAIGTLALIFIGVGASMKRRRNK